jgi:hypothetical protein
MIKPNELRIGNYIINPFGAIITIDEIHKSGVKFKTTIYDLTHCKPIPLTEEIILKCGFQKHITSDFYPTFSLKMINVNDGIVYVIGIGFLNHIKYLHQLQNIYFALTNQELNIKL